MELQSFSTSRDKVKYARVKQKQENLQTCSVPWQLLVISFIT